MLCRSSIEAAAAHEAAAIEQKARGQLERQKLHNAMESERQMCELLQIRSVSAAVESAGQAVAEARARAEKQGIEALKDPLCTGLSLEGGKYRMMGNMETQVPLGRSLFFQK